MAPASSASEAASLPKTEGAGVGGDEVGGDEVVGGDEDGGDEAGGDEAGGDESRSRVPWVSTLPSSWLRSFSTY